MTSLYITEKSNLFIFLGHLQVAGGTYFSHAATSAHRTPQNHFLAMDENAIRYAIAREISRLRTGLNGGFGGRHNLIRGCGKERNKSESGKNEATERRRKSAMHSFAMLRILMSVELTEGQ